MRMPGFTAEASHYKTNGHFHMVGAFNQAGEMVYAAQDIGGIPGVDEEISRVNCEPDTVVCGDCLCIRPIPKLNICVSGIRPCTCTTHKGLKKTFLESCFPPFPYPY